MVDVGVDVGVVLLVVEIFIANFSFLVVEETSDFLVLDYPVDLGGGELAQPVLLAGSYMFLVHAAFLPIFGHILFLCPLFEGGLLGLEGGGVNCYFEGLGFIDGKTAVGPSLHIFIGFKYMGR